MNPLCECGHTPADHDDETGECIIALAFNERGQFFCLCDRYEWAGDQ